MKSEALNVVDTEKGEITTNCLALEASCVVMPPSEQLCSNGAQVSEGCWIN